MAEAYRLTRATVPGATEAVLPGQPARGLPPASRPAEACASSSVCARRMPQGTTPIALARLGIGAGWAGLGAVWTDPAYRGRGLAARLTAALAAHLRQEDIALIHLQVEHDNDTAIRLYRRLGFDVHSSYAYLTQG